MADNKHKRGKADRAKVARLQPYEVYYLAHRYGVTPDRVKRIVKRVGNSRRAVVGALLLARE